MAAAAVAIMLALCSLHALADKPSDRCGIYLTALVSSLPGEVPTPLPTLRVAGSQLLIHLSIGLSAWCREHRRGNQHDQSGGDDLGSISGGDRFDVDIYGTCKLTVGLRIDESPQRGFVLFIVLAASYSEIRSGSRISRISWLKQLLYAIQSKLI